MGLWDKRDKAQQPRKYHIVLLDVNSISSCSWALSAHLNITLLSWYLISLWLFHSSRREYKGIFWMNLFVHAGDDIYRHLWGLGLLIFANFFYPFLSKKRGAHIYFSSALRQFTVQRFSHLIKGKCIIILGILGKSSWKNKKIHVLGIDTNPDWWDSDRHTQYADPNPDPDPAKWCVSASILIRIQNTALYWKIWRIQRHSKTWNFLYCRNNMCICF